MVAAAAFSFCYIGHKKINRQKYSYSDGDSVFFAVWMAILRPATVWFFGPYLIINLYKKD